MAILWRWEKDDGPVTKLPSRIGTWRNISVHQATAISLTAGRTYFYKVTSTDEIFNFTYSAPHGRTGPVTFAVFGDLGVKEQSGAADTMRRLLEHHVND